VAEFMHFPSIDAKATDRCSGDVKFYAMFGRPESNAAN
jgi:hypothetical protein